MKILTIMTRIYSENRDTTVRFYETLTGQTCSLRFAMPDAGLELAQVGTFLIIAGSEDALKPFRSTTATFLVDSVEEYFHFFTRNNIAIIRPPRPVPTGVNMTIQHPEGTIIEYVQHRPLPKTP
ncbi:MAG: glyoxalase [Methanomicrobiales archaeon HGW-Methanomicrobiales-5]|jgi:predicted enzyme related to lactoylglutathione lyase|nr:MAG: glyoxalase [Methanomicrobiales archaeon HGW-Methanomicrobiales-5]